MAAAYVVNYLVYSFDVLLISSNVARLQDPRDN